MNFLHYVRSFFTGNKSSGKQSRQDRFYARHIQMIYENFCQILSLNDSILQLISSIEDRLSGHGAFSFNHICQRIQRALIDVFMMVKSLTQLAPGKYSELFDALRRINITIESDIAAPKELLAGPLVLKLKDITASDAPLVGPKIANLGEVKNVLKLSVPDGFVVTVVAFNRMLDQNNFREKTEKLEELLEITSEHIASEACQLMQQMIKFMVIPQETEKAIERSFTEIIGSNCLAAVRSSSSAEDQTASHAGLFYTELNVGKEGLLKACSRVWASAYGIGPLQYRFKYGLTTEKTQMAVGILKMIVSKYFGVMFSRSFENISEDKIVFSISQGNINPPESSEAHSEELTVIPGREIESTTTIATHDIIKELCCVARKIEAHFGNPCDIEWAIDEAGIVHILQCRPVDELKKDSDRQPQIDVSRNPILAGGLMACPGIKAGIVKQIVNDDDIDRFPNRGILVAKHSSPRFAHVMERCQAIITEEGSPIGHMAILAREFRIPCIVGLPNALSALHTGREITVDASEQKIYEGDIVKIVESSGKSAVAPPSLVVQKLSTIAKSIVPLHLIDTASKEFVPANCTTLHDITRYVHEKVFEEMFYLGDRASLNHPDTFRLKGPLPYEVLALDVGGGVCENAELSGGLDFKDIISVPMKAFMEGLLDPRIKWDKPRAVSAKGFLSVIGESLVGPPAEAKGVGKVSFAIFSDKYLNFSTKAGYHFNTIDSYCGKSINKNYIHFRFEGGAAHEIRRERRCSFLSNVLDKLNFRVQAHGDILVGRLEKYGQEFTANRLKELGRLTLCARQLDMLMDSDRSAEFFAEAFLEGRMERF